MSADLTGLGGLHDIVMRAPAPWWPPAPGWYWLMGFVVTIGTVLLWRAIVHWQRNCYRREALAELARILARIEARIESAAIADQARERSDDSALPALAELLKRTALAAYPREQVAALTGPAWFAFLDQTGGTNFSGGLGAALAHGNYFSGKYLTPDSLSSEMEYAHRRSAEIASEIRRWIEQHTYVDDAQSECKLPAARPPTNKKSGAAEVS